MIKEFENWIEVSTNGDRKVSRQLINALSAAHYSDLNPVTPENIVMTGDVFVSNVEFDVSTNTFTFTMSDDTTVVAKVGPSSSEDIVLENDRALKGKGSNGDKYNLIKVSPMNITEVGSTSSPMNLSSSEIPTVQIPNQSPKSVAISTDIEVLDSKISEVRSSSETGLNSLSQELGDRVTSLERSKANASEVYTKSETDNRIKEVVGTAPEALDTLKEIADSLANDPNFASTMTNELTRVNTGLSEVRTNMESSVNSINSVIESEIKPDLSKSVKYSDASDGRKTVQLKNNDTISGLMTNGTGVNIAMVSKWDVVDLGSTSLPINLNTPMGVRPTVQEMGQSGEEANKIAYLSDIESLDSKYVLQEDGKSLSTEDFTTPLKSKLEGMDLSVYATKSEIPSTLPNPESVTIKYNGETKAVYDGSSAKEVNIIVTADTLTGLNERIVSVTEDKADKSDITRLDSSDIAIKSDIMSAMSRLNELEDKISQMNKTNIESVTIEGAPESSLSDNSKDYVIGGNINSGSSLDVSGKSVQLKNANVSNNTRVSMSSVDDIDVKSTLVIGDFPKNNGGNAVVKLNGSGYVTIKDMTFNATLYNALEIGLNTVSKSILIDNCRFEGAYSNNAISIFGTQDNSVININNCYFENVSNVFRFSNKANSKCTINITNCKCDHWDTSSSAEYRGMILFQDYTSSNVAEEESNNLFGKEKITVNISNFTLPDGSILKSPADLSTICGSHDDNQILYVYCNNGGSIPYGDGSRYPTVNIN